jgi:NADPH:quinone reductase-like Zn-dependent oxidoreductase
VRSAALYRRGLKKGGRVLVIGASGGCGLAACQLANAMGASEAGLDTTTFLSRYFVQSKHSSIDDSR